MCAADKVALMNTFNGANLGTVAASRAKRIVDNRKIVDNLNCAMRTSLLTLHATNTTVGWVAIGYKA